MSLRVLLADESASIRKVFQMALQDYGAEVKSVQNGLDVVEVAETYRPDIIFADILLQKKSGYEVCEEVQHNSKLRQVPIVLMWSSFMELDQKRFKNSGAKGELEKPFDVEIMRKLIQTLVQKTEGQTIAKHLSFPQSITQTFIEEESEKSQTHTPAPAEKQSTAQATPPPVPVAEEPVAAHDELELDLDLPEDFEFQVSTEDSPKSLEEIESESQFNIQAFADDDVQDDEPLQQQKSPAPQREDEDMMEESWAVRPLHMKSTKSEQPAPPHHYETEDFQSMSLHQEQKPKLDDFLYKPQSEPTPPPVQAPPVVKATPPPAPPAFTTTQTFAPSNQPAHGISPEEAEAIIRSETRIMLKEMLSNELTSVLEKVVREELNKILREEIHQQTQG